MPISVFISRLLRYFFSCDVTLRNVQDTTHTRVHRFIHRLCGPYRMLSSTCCRCEYFLPTTTPWKFDTVSPARARLIIANPPRGRRAVLISLLSYIIDDSAAVAETTVIVIWESDVTTATAAAVTMLSRFRVVR